MVNFMKIIYIKETNEDIIKEAKYNLTEMFGEGKEPTLKKFINMFPEIYFKPRRWKIWWYKLTHLL